MVVFSFHNPEGDIMDQNKSVQESILLDGAIQNILDTNLAKAESISNRCSADVIYLRSRSRWTIELENELISQHESGNAPDINTFGVTKETQEALMLNAWSEICKTFQKSESPKVVTLHQTASGTYRLLVNGQVHPCLVGYTSKYEAIHKGVSTIFRLHREKNTQLGEDLYLDLPYVETTEEYVYMKG